jgi:hypothetical protein
MYRSAGRRRNAAAEIPGRETVKTTRSHRRIVLMSLTGAGLLATTSAFALGTGTSTNLGGASIAAGTVGTVALSGECHFAQAAAGIDTSGSTYVLEGVGTAGGVVGGSPVVATGIQCAVGGHVSGPDFTPGGASATVLKFTANSVSGKICTTVYYLTRDGHSGNLPTECH